ncbi:MAG: PBP1A family penicillin-binding protein [Candidatus Binatia bacterium]|nr:PBP1A family penicillin-binding protein [Candidatus Binatia bacterium]
MLRRIFRFFFWTVTLTVVAAGLVAFVLWRELSQDLPPVEELLRYRPPAATLVYAADGSLIGEFFEERRYPVSIFEVPRHVKDAFLAAEDTEFHAHRGVDFQAMVRAFLANWQRDTIVQGASTITQQVVKQLLLSPERSYERKLKEIILATQLESKLRKEKILELYLNEIYFGAGSYGIVAASETYFGVGVQDLTIAQSALLAGLAKAPSRYNPQTNPERAIERQRYVLRRMLDEDLITPEEFREATAEPSTFDGYRIGTYSIAPWYVEHVRRLLEAHFGANFTSRGLRVHTAMDPAMQAAAVSTLHTGLGDIERRYRLRVTLDRLKPDEFEAYLNRQRGTHPLGNPQNAIVTAVVTKGEEAGLRLQTPWEKGGVDSENLVAARGKLKPGFFRPGDAIAVDPIGRAEDGTARFALDPDPQVEGALVSIEPDTGLVKAMVGGVDYARSQFNRAVLAQRQPGSIFKPFVFAAAIDQGFSPDSIFMDAPISLPNGARGLWSPRNFGDKYYGAVPLRKALAKSLNSVTVRLVGNLGIDPLRDYLDIFGFQARFARHASIVLGSSEVTPLELARAYGVFATEGRRFEPIFITGITDSDGNPIDFPGAHARFLPVMQPETARTMTDMLTTVVQEGTGRAAKKLERPAAGKTGTTNDSKDVWFAGFTPDLVTVVWVGYDGSRPLGRRVTGGGAAAPLWTKYMAQVLEGREIREFTPPELAPTMSADIEPATGAPTAPPVPAKQRPTRDRPTQDRPQAYPPTA